MFIPLTLPEQKQSCIARALQNNPDNPRQKPSPARAGCIPFTRCSSQHERSWWAKTLEKNQG